MKKKNSRHVRLTSSLGMKTGKMPIDRHLMIKHGGRKSAIAARTPAPHTQTVARRRGGVLGVPKRPPPQPQAPRCLRNLFWRGGLVGGGGVLGSIYMLEWTRAFKCTKQVGLE